MILPGVVAQQMVDAGGGAVVSAQRWRVVYVTLTSGTDASLGEIAMRLTSGGANQCTGGTPSSKSQYSASYSADKALDGSTGTMAHAAGGQGVGWWWEYDFGSAKAITEVMLQAATAGAGRWAQMPATLRIEYWDGSAWVAPLGTQTTSPAWNTDGQQKTYAAQ